MQDKKKSDLTSVLFVLKDRSEGNLLSEKIPQIDNSWAVQITDNADEALDFIRSNNIDVLICDSEVNDRPGMALIESAHREKPGSLAFLRRITQPNSEESMELSQKKIFFLPGNLEEEGIYSHVSRRILMRSLSENPNLLSVIRRMKKMPTIPQLYHQITRELHKEDGSIEFVAGLISKEPSMSTRILKAVNSPVYGLGYEITEVVHALLFLGKDATQAQILADSVFSSYPSESIAGLHIQEVWKHSINVSAIARHISMQIDQNKKASEVACTAGVIHDLGKVLMAANLPDHYSQAVKIATEEKIPMVQAEQRVFGTNHAEVAASLMGLWAIPFKILNSVAYHHNPVGGPKSPPTATMALYMANGIENARSKSALGQRYSEEIIDQWGLATQFAGWLEDFSQK
jgi:HD-like signal output (HDOD) protein